MNQPDLLAEYQSLTPRLSQALGAIERRLQDVLSDPELKVHSLASRLKSESSFKQKIARPDRTYRSVYDVTDILGLRVITYFEDSVEEIGRLIEKNFDVDFTNSTNKLRNQDFERFGYRSLHYVCSVPEVQGLRFEIQIRTILQHAWAEIEHDLGYKTISGVPGVIRRRFSQIASILEIADREFVAIRQDVNAYEKTLRLSNVEGRANLPLDLLSLEAALDHDVIAKLDRSLAAFLHLPFSNEAFFPEYVLEALLSAHLKTVDDVVEAVRRHEEHLENFVEPYFKFAEAAWGFQKTSIDVMKRGYSLLFIAHLEMLSRDPLILDKVNQAARFYQALDYPDSPANATDVGRRLVESLQEAGFFTRRGARPSS